jgi:hypothetical protein
MGVFFYVYSYYILEEYLDADHDLDHAFVNDLDPDHDLDHDRDPDLDPDHDLDLDRDHDHDHDPDPDPDPDPDDRMIVKDFLCMFISFPGSRS